ncbi:MAG: urease accessory UreF family protein [Lachnospiraceae bacterium]|nr:urease accessory UreF family protein [Lachnospiraceae bacterium]
MNSMKSFLSIMQSVDSFFPIGAFTLSNGLEDYVVRERIQTSEDLQAYLKGFLQVFPYNDLGVLSLAYRNYQDKEYLLLLDGYVCAMKSAKEVRIGSSRMCSRYIKAREAMLDCGGELSWYRQQMQCGNVIGSHPIALGIYGAAAGVEQTCLLTMYGYSVLSAIVNNAVKLVPLRQLDGQRILYESLEMLEDLAKQAVKIEIQDLGVSGVAYEIHCMNHEQLYARQYMS